MISFVGLSIQCKKDFYDRAADLVIKERSGGLTYMNAADRVAAEFGIRLAKLDRQRLETLICNRAQGRKIVLQRYEVVSPIKVEPPGMAVEPMQKKNNRIGKCGRKRKDVGDAIPSNKLKKAFKVAASHLEYQQIRKEEASIVAIKIRDEGFNMNAAAKCMQSAPERQGVVIHKYTAVTHIKATAQLNNFIGVSPQKPCGALLPSHTEKHLAKSVKSLRQRSFPVFPDEVMHWATDAIKGTEYESLFPNGKPARGWFNGWIKRIHFFTSALRPLEDRWAYWFLMENLERYFEVARDVLLNAGVAVSNPDNASNLPYSQELISTVPEKICSYKDTKMEMDCTKAGKGNDDKTIRDGVEDGNTAIVTKSSKCGSAVCDRLGDGRALLVFTVVNSDDSFEPAWASHYIMFPMTHSTRTAHHFLGDILATPRGR